MARRLSPRLRLERVITLQQGQNLYADLGKTLSTASESVQWRTSAKEVRRELEYRFGGAVRATSASEYVSPMRGGYGIVLPTWSKRHHGSYEKPGGLGPSLGRSPASLAPNRPPFVLHLTYDPNTGENTGTYADLGEAVLSGLRDGANRSVQKRQEGPRAFRERQLSDQILALETLLGGGPGSLALSLDRLSKYLKRLKREKEGVERAPAMTVGGGRGSAPD